MHGTFKNLIELSGFDYVPTDAQIIALKKIALWYANDERFKGDLKKGMLLRGSCGTGKSLIATVLEQTIKIGQGNIPTHITAVQLQEAYTNNDELKKEMLANRLFVIIDDLGTESAEVKNFGNSILPFNTMFDERYRDKKTTIITTNLTPSKIEEVYGIRIRDRFRECMNEIVLDFKSMRK